MQRKRASPLWEYFTILDKEKCVARCHICHRLFSFKTTITNLKRHVERKHPNEELVSYIREENEESDVSQRMLQVSENDWKHLTDHEYMQKKYVCFTTACGQQSRVVTPSQVGVISVQLIQVLALPTTITIKISTYLKKMLNSAAVKTDVQEEGEVELEFLQDITAADVDHITGEEEKNFSDMKCIPSMASAKKYLKLRKLPLHHSSHHQRHSNSYKICSTNHMESDRQYSTTLPSSTEDDEFERFGRHVAAQLRQLPLHSCLLVQESIQSLITRERIASLDEPLTDRTSYEEVQE